MEMIQAATNRPQMPVGHNIPPAFDAQTSQINATHVTKEVAASKTKRNRKTAAR